MKPVQFKNTQIPLHYQIADYLTEMLRKGEIDPAKKLFPEEEMTVIFGVSRTTVRKALEHLHHSGLLYSKRGSGTFWTEKANSINNEKLSGINRQIFNTEKTQVKVLSKTHETGTEEVNLFFNNPSDTEYTVYKRLRTIDGEPMSYTTNYLPRETGDSILPAHLESMTMLETLEKVLGISLGIIEHEVEITRIDSEISKILQLSALDPVLTVKTSVFDNGSCPVEIVWTHFVETKYKFKVVLENK